jgi:hypothetical protein
MIVGSGAGSSLVSIEASRKLLAAKNQFCVAEGLFKKLWARTCIPVA